MFRQSLAAIRKMKLIHIITVLTLLTSCGQLNRKTDQEAVGQNQQKSNRSH